MPHHLKKTYSCTKCGHSEYEVGEVRTSGGLWSSLFDFNTERFSYVACARCQYTDLYRARLGDLNKVVDFLMS